VDTIVLVLEEHSASIFLSAVVMKKTVFSQFFGHCFCWPGLGFISFPIGMSGHSPCNILYNVHPANVNPEDGSNMFL
jgi:hypothetical protein